MRNITLFAVLLVGSLAFAQNSVPAKFWGIQIHNNAVVYPPSPPNVPYPFFQTLRLWDTKTGWADMNDNEKLCEPPSNGIYDFSNLDTFMTTYASNGWDVIYTVAKTPCFFSANPTDSSCASDFGAGQCDPPGGPQGITCSGNYPGNTGGSDTNFTTFLTDLWTHIKKQGYYKNYPNRQWYVEVWNEPDTSNWDGGWIQNTYCSVGGKPDPTAPYRILVRMAADAQTTIHGLDPKVKFLTPPVNDPLKQMGPGGWEYAYLSWGGWKYADILSAHAYLKGNPVGNPVEDVCCDPNTSIVGLTFNTRKHFFTGLTLPPIFFTEGGYGKNGNQVPSDVVAWTGTYYTLLLSSGLVASLDWYAYDIDAKMWDQSMTALTPTGTAVAVMQQDWGYDGGAFDVAGCTEKTCGNGNRWTCNLTEGGSRTQAQVAWYDGAVNDGSCSYSPGGNPPWVDYRDLSGDPPTGYNGELVPLTNRPILFEHGLGQ
jgi:hypothetical protein